MKSIRFFMDIIGLKDLKRTGWVHKGVENPESVAGHMFGVASLAMLVPLPKGVNRDKLVKMAVIHDWSEAEVWDIKWEAGKFSDREKEKRKNASEKGFFKRAAEKLDRPDIKDLSWEFLDQTSPEAKFHQILFL